MKALPFPNREELVALKETLHRSPEEQVYWNGFISRLKEKFVEPTKRESEGYFKAILDNNHPGLITFYLEELQNIPEQIGQRKIVERDIKYHLGYAHEYAAENVMKNNPPLERAEMFANAAAWYHAADEAIGYHTGIALRQAESIWGAAEFRRKASLDDDVTALYARRGDELFKGYLGKARNHITAFLSPQEQIQLTEFFDKVTHPGEPSELSWLKKIKTE